MPLQSPFSAWRDLGFCNYLKGEPRFRGPTFTNKYSSTSGVNLLSACFSWLVYRMAMPKKIAPTTSAMEAVQNLLNNKTLFQGFFSKSESFHWVYLYRRHVLEPILGHCNYTGTFCDCNQVPRWLYIFYIIIFLKCELVNFITRY